MITSKDILKDIDSYSRADKKKFLPKFFKTGKGEYGEGDIFLGVMTPDMRIVTKKYRDIPLGIVKELIHHKIHEMRSLALGILVYRFEKGNEQLKTEIYEFYMDNLEGVNNWDLVDISCPKIVGAYLLSHPEEKDILYSFAKDSDIWKRRISVISTFVFIRNGELDDTLKISKILLSSKEDLIHKAVGWMLREVGKKDIDVLRKFLNENIHNMPRTTLRYAIEKMEEKERKKYLNL